MTTLRNTLFKILCSKTVSQLISINHRQSSKKCPDNKAVHFSFDDFPYINQSVKKSQNAPITYYKGVPIIIIMRPTSLIIRLLAVQNSSSSNQRNKNESIFELVG